MNSQPLYNKKIRIVIKSDDVSWDEIAHLLHNSFEERKQQGLNFTCSSVTADMLERQNANSIVFVALLQNELIGTVSMKIMQFKSYQYAYHYNLAVAPDYKGKGIADMLFNKFIENAINNECSFIKSDTAERAYSSVSWHKKNGFCPITIRSYGSTNYYSILFRKQLKYHWFWSNQWLCKVYFALSSFAYKRIKNEKGDYIGIGRVIKLFHTS
ncbi:MAG: GNAT family N-acetyltransferase [Muribaculaceae bacterium]|nr:GNAT family N-acetyltransferase [Muribaculaceae bacterium]